MNLLCNVVVLFIILTYLFLQSLQKTGKATEIGRKYKCQVWSSVVTIVLIKIKNCTIAEGLCDPYVRFRYVLLLSVTKFNYTIVKV